MAKISDEFRRLLNLQSEGTEQLFYDAYLRNIGSSGNASANIPSQSDYPDAEDEDDDDLVNVNSYLTPEQQESLTPELERAINQAVEDAVENAMEQLYLKLYRKLSADMRRLLEQEYEVTTETTTYVQSRQMTDEESRAWKRQQTYNEMYGTRKR